MKLMLKIFGLNIIGYNSISRFAFDTCVKDATDILGRNEGLEYLSSETHHEAWRKCIFGGYSSCRYYGKTIEANNLYLPGFDPTKPQIYYLPVDKTSCYAGALLTDLPYSNLEYFDSNSDRVKKLNEHIEGNEFMSLLGQDGRKVYYLIEVTIYFDHACQEKLKHFVPVIRKGTVGKDDVSSRQRDLIESLGLGFDPKMSVNLQDFMEQRQSLSYPYLELLLNLGVGVRAIHSLATAAAFPIFRRIINKMLELKKAADNDFERNWYKLMCNSS